MRGTRSWHARWRNTWWTPWSTPASSEIYGIVGDSLNPVTDAIRRSGSLRWLDVRHEETAAFAAGAEAQLTGRLAVCAGSCGPGNLHLINGLYDAHRSGAPVLAIAAHIPSTEVGTGYFQETHPDQLFRECSHYCELVSHPRQAAREIILLGTDFPYESYHADDPRDRPDRPPPSGWAGGRGSTWARGTSATRSAPGAAADRFLDASRAAPPSGAPPYVDRVSPRRPIHPEHVAATLDELAGPDAVFTVDTGMCARLGPPIPTAPGRRFLGSFNHGSMANALPRQTPPTAYPGRRVISLSGDGGLAMMREADGAQYRVGGSNHRLGMVQLEQEAAGLPHGVERKNPNFAALAEAVGLKGLRVEDPEAVRPHGAGLEFAGRCWWTW